MPEAIRNYIIGFIIAFLLLGLFIILLGVLYSRRQMKNKADKEKMEAEFSESLLQSQLEIQEETFNHISKEIHDNLGIAASVIKINLNTIQLENAEQSTQKIEETKDLVKQLILDLKLLSLNLSSDRITQMGLVKLLQTDAERINKSGSMEVTVHSTGTPFRLQPDKETILYRISQEILNNALKYSQAKNVSVKLAFSEKNFTLTVTDDGIGFNAAELLKTGLEQGHNGLHNLQKRSALINARLTVTSTPGNGTNISVELPL